MKLFIYDREGNLVEEIKGIENLTSFSTNEVRWERGGMGGIEHEFVISDQDETKFEEITEEEKTNQFRQQKIKEVEREKEKTLTRGLLTAKQKQDIQEEMQAVIADMKNAQNKEEIIRTDFIEKRYRRIDQRGGAE